MIAVEIRAAVDPTGRRGVLLQFEHGWIVLPPIEAQRLAQQILDVADEALRTIAQEITGEVLTEAGTHGE